MHTYTELKENREPKKTKEDVSAAHALLATLVSAAILWASSASTSGSVSAFLMVCWSFCSASSSLSCSCRFFSSICADKRQPRPGGLSH